MSLLNAATSESKFALNKKGRIVLTESGNAFIEKISGKQVTGAIRKITKKEAYVWVDKFTKLSDKDAQKSKDFTPTNNFLNHLALCDTLLADLYRPGENNSLPLAKGEGLPEGRKKMIKIELDKLRVKLTADVVELVSEGSRENLSKIIDFYDTALKETLELNTLDSK